MSKNGLKLAAVFTAVVLGAGFASGQELLRYFVRYGPAGVAGIMLAGVVFAVVGWAALDICRRHQLTSYGAFARFLLGERLGAAMEGLVGAFLFVLLSAMLAAAGATVKQAADLPFAVGAAGMGALCYLVLRHDLRGFVRVNVVLAPFMAAGSVLVGLYAFFTQAAPAFAGTRFMPGWAAAAFVYASYNLVTGIPVLVSASALAARRRDALLGGAGGGAVMTLLGLCLALPLYLHYTQAVSAEIPLLVITLQYGALFNGLYLAVLVCAVFTTAVSNAFALTAWLTARFALRKDVAAAWVCLAAAGMAFIGFGPIVGYLYPVFGLLGLFNIVVILLRRFV